MRKKNSNFFSVKIVGVSGIGKTSLIKKVLANMDNVSHICFSEYLNKFGYLAQEKMSLTLDNANGIVLMDEHLEIGDDDLFELYKKENTIGIFIIEADPQDILKRRIKDKTRIRCQDDKKIEKEQNFSRIRATKIALHLSIPLVIARGGSLNENLSMLISFLKFLEQDHRDVT